MSNILNVYRGDDANIEITVTDKDGDAFSLASLHNATLSVKELETSTEYLLQRKGSVQGDPADGVVLFAISHTQTEVTPGTYYYDVQLVFNDGSVYTAVKNSWICIYDITRNLASS